MYINIKENVQNLRKKYQIFWFKLFFRLLHKISEKNVKKNNSINRCEILKSN